MKSNTSGVVFNFFLTTIRRMGSLRRVQEWRPSERGGGEGADEGDGFGDARYAVADQGEAVGGFA